MKRGQIPMEKLVGIGLIIALFLVILYIVKTRFLP